MPSFDQVSFIDGQVSERVFGRTDLPSFQSSLALARNCIIEPEGSVSKRPGTSKVFYSDLSVDWQTGTAKRSSLSGTEWLLKDNEHVRLIPFRYSNNEQYVLVFRDNRMDVVKEGRVIAHSIETPWDGDDLNFDPDDDSRPGIKFSQRGDFMVVTHPQYAPRQIVRRSENGTRWDIELIVRRARRPSGTNLRVLRGRSPDNDEPDYDFEWIVLGVGENDEYLSEVPVSAGSDIQGITEARGIATLQVEEVAAANEQGGVPYAVRYQVGQSVLLQGMTGAGELEGRVFNIRSVQLKATSDTKEERVGPWQTGLTLTAATTAALNALPSDYREDVEYETLVSGSNEQTERRRVFFRAVVYSASEMQADMQESVVTGMVSEYFSGWSLNPRTLSESEREFDTFSLGASSSVRAAGTTYPESNSGSMSVEIVSAEIPSGTATWRHTATGIVELIRSVSVSDGRVFRARATGKKTVAAGSRYYLLGIETGVASITPWVSGGTAVGTILRVSGAKRDTQFTLRWDPVGDVDHYAIFQRVESDFRIIGRTIGPSDRFLVQSITGQELTPPPTFRNPFATSNPNCSAVFQQRQGFGGFEERNRFEFSRPKVLDQFDITRPIKPDDAISGVLASGEIDEIRHMIPLGDVLFLLTGGDLWSLSGEGVFTPDTLYAKKEQEYGSSNLRPLVVGNILLSVNEQGTVIHATRYSRDDDGYITSEMSVLFNDILAEKNIVDWDYVEGHLPLVIAVLDDGTAVCVTYRPDDRVIAAGTWDFGGGWKCVGVSTKNTDRTDPIAVFCMRNDEGGFALRSMSFRRGGLNWEFRADGVSEHLFSGNLEKEQGKWIRYLDDSREMRFDLGSADYVMDEDRRGTRYWKGDPYETVVRSLPVWDLVGYNLKKAFVRFIRANNPFVKVLPAGDAKTIYGSTEDNLNLEGFYGVLCQGYHRSTGPQVEVSQKHPSPMLLTGLGASDTDRMDSTGSAGPARVSN